MQLACKSIPSPEAFAPGIIGYLDCQAQTLGAQGYQALAAPGSTAAILLTGMVTLLIALFGYRMLLGYTPTIRDGVLTFVKIGLVLALATSWPAYQTVIYDIILRGPAELAAAIGGPAGLPGAAGGLVARLDGVDQALKVLAIEGVGAPPLGPDGLAQMPSVAPSPFIGFDAFALGFSRVGFLVGAIASFAVVRLVAGLLLALGPLFAAFLLFDGTRGLFEGWVKALLGSALAALATSIVLGVELAFMEPWLSSLLARRASGLDILGAPAQLFAATLIFAIALFAVVVIVARVAMSLRIPAWNSVGAASRSDVNSVGSTFAAASSASGAPIESRSRAAAVADAVAITQRREAMTAAATGVPAGSAGRGTLRMQRDQGLSGEARISSPAQGPQRRTGYRVSARAASRDRSR